jgi:hypothetical protein
VPEHDKSNFLFAAKYVCFDRNYGYYVFEGVIIQLVIVKVMERVDLIEELASSAWRICILRFLSDRKSASFEEMSAYFHLEKTTEGDRGLQRTIYELCELLRSSQVDCIGGRYSIAAAGTAMLKQFDEGGMDV